MKKSLNIALDFDDTFTCDPAFWLSFIKLAHKQGHQVYICTMRHDFGRERQEVEEAINGLVPIIFCCRKWKKKVAEEKDIHISIWIDDMPAAIMDQRNLYINEYTTGEQLHIWDWLDG